MNRRRFIGSILAAGVAPAIVRADSLMRIVPRENVLLMPVYDGILTNPSEVVSAFAGYQISNTALLTWLNKMNRWVESHNNELEFREYPRLAIPRSAAA